MITQDQIRDYIVKEFMPGNNPEEITPELNLVETGIIDSLGILKLVAFLERTSKLTVNAEELELDRFKTINSIYELIAHKRDGKSDKG